MAGRHAAGQTTRRAPLTREITIRTAAPSADASPSAVFGGTISSGRRGKPDKDEYRAKHAFRRTRRPIAPLATAAAVTVAVAAVGLVQAAASTSKAGDQEPASQPAKQPASRETAQPMSPSQTRPSPSAKTAAAKKVRTVVIGACKASFDGEPQGTANKSWKTGTGVRVTNPRNGKSMIVRGASVSGRCIDLSRAAVEDLGRGVTPVR